ncbi:MAG: hypothetical protein HQL14_04400 [Candidatus Omnitrophica bacterium]|nr:hypothetical protein [Candidatus Omnitrophota bacterium]
MNFKKIASLLKNALCNDIAGVAFRFFLFILFIIPASVQAADIQAQLDSNDGTSGFSVQKLNLSEVARVDSTGNLFVHGNVGVGTAMVVLNGNTGIGTWVPHALLDISTGSTGPTFESGAGNVYIQNDLEVDGTAYLAEATIASLTISGGQSISTSGSTFNTLTVLHDAFLATTSGNVGIGTTVPGSMLAVGATSQFAVSLTGAVTTSGSYTQTGAGINAFAGNLGVGTNAPQNLLAVGPASQFQVAPSGAIKTAGGYTQTGAGANTLLGITTFSNNVGIGTAVPQALLDISTTPGAFPLFESGPGNVYMQHDLEVDGTAFLAEATIGTLNVTEGLTFTSGSSLFSTLTVTGNTYLATVSGNVGINSVAPGQTLDVNGTVRILGTNALNLGSDNKASIAASAATTPDIRFLTNNAEVMRITNGGNVGIGSASPGYALDVNGTVKAIAFVGNGAGLTGVSSSGGWTEINTNVFSTGTLVGIGTVLPGNMFAVGPASQFTVSPSGAVLTSGSYTQTGSGINSFSGNVGIGSVSPAYNLDVNGTVKATSFIGGGAQIMGVTTAAGWTEIGTNVYTTGTNVGIGSTSPSHALDVQGSVYLSGNMGIGVTNPAAKLNVVGGIQSGSIFGNTSYNAFFNEKVGTGSVVAWAFDVVNNGVSYNNNLVMDRGTVGIGIAPSSTGYPDTLNVGGTGYFSGNVGIGTSAPSAQLQVGSGNPAFFTSIPSSEFIQNDLEVDGTAYLVDATIGNLTVTSGITLTTGSALFNTLTVTGPTYLATTNGNVGIGTVLPAQKLDVIGSVKAISFIGNGTQITGVTTGAGWTEIGTNVYTTGTNVGIGTVSPGNLLAVGGASQFAVSPAGSISTSGSYTQSGTGANTLTGNTAFNASPISATFAGNVGINSVAPGQMLDVNGTVRITGTSSLNLGSDNTAAIAPSASTTPDIKFVANSAEAMRIANTGNVGIGSATPAYKLDVNGTVKAIAFIGNGSGLTGVSSGGGWTEINTNVFTVGTLVGIGTTTPGNALDVRGTVYLSGNVGIGTQAANSAALAVFNTGGFGISLDGATLFNNMSFAPTTNFTGISYDKTKQNLVFDSNNNGPQLLLGPNGNVGIGTSAAAVQLQVGAGAPQFFTAGAGSEFIQNDLEVDGTAYLMEATIASLTITSGLTLTGGSVFDTLTVKGNTFLATQTGNVGVGTTLPSQKFDVEGTAYFNSNVGIASISPSHALDVQGSTYFGGNMGIGSTSPSHALDVQGSTYFGGNVGIGTTAPPSALTTFAQANPNVTSIDTGNGGSPVLYHIANTFNSMNVTTASGINNVSDLNYVYINPSVPISSVLGMTNIVTVPSTNSTVWNATITGFRSSASNYGSAFTGTLNGGSFAASNNGGAANLGTVTGMSILASIGGSAVSTSNLVYGLNVSVINNNSSATVNNLYGIYIQGIDTSGGVINNPYDIYASDASASNYMAGSLGIGMYSPVYTLDLNGGSSDIGDSSAGVLTLQGQGGSVATQHNILDNGNGYVGIGSVSPAYQLDVNGTVKAIAFIGNGASLTGITNGGGWTLSGTNVFTTGTVVGIGVNNPQTTLQLNGTLAMTPSAVTSIAPAGSITVNSSVMRIQGSGGVYPVVISNITAGVDGQVVTLIGSGTTNTVQLVNGGNIKLSSGIPFTMGLHDIMALVYDQVQGFWTEITRAAD